MDENTAPRRGRATAGASALGAAALLVLSFGPSALALSPSGPASTPQTVRVAVSSAPAPSASGATPRGDEEPDGEDR